MPISKSIKLKSLISKSTLEFFFDVFFHASSFSNLGSIDISGHATSIIGTKLVKPQTMPFFWSKLLWMHFEQYSICSCLFLFIHNVTRLSEGSSLDYVRAAFA